MGAYPEMSAFRWFGLLNALNLLYLQAELVGLENKLQKQAKTDAQSKHFEPSIYHRDWQTLSKSHTMLEIREKLKEYNQAIHLQHLIAKFRPPSEQDFRSLQIGMKTPSMGNVYLLGVDSDVWENPDASELICLKPNKTDSLITRFFTNKLITLYHHIIGHHFKVYNMTTRLAMIGVFTAVFSLALGIFTNGRMVEIFSATAA
ncbi:hypothetical protein F4803DRAFT_567435 [Xylaria telfairii]|nr:hypothetical protein F4803DRAFT_567435 [Xylaria telfairii]